VKRDLGRAHVSGNRVAKQPGDVAGEKDARGGRVRMESVKREERNSH